MMYPIGNDDKVNPEVAAELLRRLARYAESEAERLLGLDKDNFSQRIRQAFEDHVWASRWAGIYEAMPKRPPTEHQPVDESKIPLKYR